MAAELKLWPKNCSYTYCETMSKLSNTHNKIHHEMLNVIKYGNICMGVCSIRVLQIAPNKAIWCQGMLANIITFNKRVCVVHIIMTEYWHLLQSTKFLLTFSVETHRFILTEVTVFIPGITYGTHQLPGQKQF